MATPEEIAARQLGLLNERIEQVLASNDFHGERFRAHGVKAGDFRSLDELRRLPEMSKPDVLASMARRAPFGDFLGVPESSIREVVSSSGTTGGVREIVALTNSDLARAVEVAARDQHWKGGSPGDRAMYCVNLGVTTAPTIVVAGWQRAGLVPLRAGPYSTEERIDLFVRFRPAVVQLSRTYAPRFIDGCRAAGVDPRVAVPNLKAIRTAGASYDQTFIDEVEDFFGAPLHEGYGSTQSVHPIAGTCEHVYGTPHKDRLMHIHEHDLIVEVLHPETREPVNPGELGEVVITTIGREASTLIRYATHDLVRLAEGRCPCGRRFRSIAAGAISRLDDMLRIKNTNIWLEDLERTILASGWIREFSLELFTDEVGREQALLLVEAKDGTVDHPTRSGQLKSNLRELYHIGFDVQFMPAGSVVHEMLKSRRCTDRRNQSVPANP